MTSPTPLRSVVKTATAKFDETVEIHIKLGVDSRHADQQVRGAIVLPNGTGKTRKVLVFAKDAKARRGSRQPALTMSAAWSMVEKITKENWFDFDVVVATPDMMGIVGRLGKVLGPKGLMPSPKAGTVTPNVAAAVKEIKAGKIEYRLDKTNIIHCPIGKVSFGAEKLTENFEHAALAPSSRRSPPLQRASISAPASWPPPWAPASRSVLPSSNAFDHGAAKRLSAP